MQKELCSSMAPFHGLRAGLFCGRGTRHQNGPSLPASDLLPSPTPRCPPWLSHRQVTVLMSWQTAASHVGCYSEPSPGASAFKSSEASTDSPGSRSPPLPLARRWKGTRVRTQLLGDVDQPGPSLSPATSSDCYKSPILHSPISQLWIILPTLQDFFDY